MAVMTHAHTQLPTEVNLHDLPEHAIHAFWRYMATADQTIVITDIRAHEQNAATAIGLAWPASQEIAVCGCGCNCQIVFDADQAHLYNEGYGETAQCPACADAHRGTTAE